jgi:lipid-binding SYLF domain-containing protein
MINSTFASFDKHEKEKEMKADIRKPIIVIAVLCMVVGTGQLAAQDKSWEDLDKQAKQAKINETAKESLDEVLKESKGAKELYNNSFGWAAFDNLKIAWGFSGGGGNGVAVNKKSGARTYMKVGTVGVGLGLGAQKYQVVFLFQDEKTFKNFVEKGWQADATAQATAGTAGVGGQTGFVNGIAIYQITDKGLMASADVAGTKYWKNKKLNK